MVINDKGTVPFYTKRLYLRRFRTDDAAEMFEAYAKDPEVTKYLRWPAHQNVEVTWHVLGTWANNYKEKDFYQWVVCLRETGEIIGSISAFEPEEAYKQEGTLEVGYCYGKKYWGNGYATEALRGMLTFLTLCGYENFVALHDKHNPASGKVMQYAGMRRKGEASIKRQDNKTLHCVLYEGGRNNLRL